MSGGDRQSKGVTPWLNALQGDLRWHDGDRFAIVVSRYNGTVTGRLLTGARERLEAAGVPPESIDVVAVPGAWELPAAARRVLAGRAYAGVICLGCVIRGETTHDRYINAQVSRLLGELAYQSCVPVAFGLLTCQTMEQALQRAGGRVGNKGSEAAEAVLEMADLFRRLPIQEGQPTITLASSGSHPPDPRGSMPGGSHSESAQ